MAPPQFSVLGPVEVTVGGEAFELAGRRQRRLLAALLLKPNRVASADELIECVWDSDPPRTARVALQVHVSQLRKALGADAIVTRPGGYLLRLEPEQLDAVRFERLLQRSRDEQQPERRAAVLREALGLVRGGAFGDLAAEAFARPEALRLDELVAGALEERIAADLAAGPSAELIAELEALIAAHPWRERPRALLMAALYRSGRQADALAVYREARLTLVEQLGVEPGSELRRLERAILAQDPSLERPGAGAAAIPAPAAPLVGRERELAEVAALVAGRNRIVTLTGPGGIGKSRLAIELAHRLSPAFGGSVAYVPLDAVEDPQLVGPTIAQAVGATPGASLAETFRARPGLLVLDGFERVADARRLLSELVSGAPELIVVVTSRRVLQLRGERNYPVPPLEQEFAVQLFVERARRGTPSADAVVAEICARLDGLPLAIELAAARTQLLSPDALLARLGSLDVLGAGARDAPERHQTLRATIDWSYELLSEDERRLFAQLAVFVGGSTLEAAEVVCGGDVLKGLAALVDSSLVQRSDDAEPRFTMLDTVREYALERLASDPEAGALRRKHARVSLALAEEFEGQYVVSRAGVYERVEAELGNVRAAFAYLLESGASDDALRLATALRRFWEVRGHLEEGQRALEAALGPAGAEPSLRVRALNGLAILVAEQGNFGEAAQLFTQSLELARELGDAHRAANALSNLGNVRLYQGRLKEARAAYVEAAAVWEAAGNRGAIVSAKQNLANLDRVEGRPMDARRMLEEASVLAREHGDPLLVSSVQRDLARTLIELDRIVEARAALAEASPVMREFGHLPDLAAALELRAAIAAAEDEPDLAAGLLGAASRVRTSTGALHPLNQADLVERTRASVRDRLGAEAFTAAFAGGEALPLDEAVGLL